MNNSDWTERRSGKQPDPKEYRSPYMRDECRVVHSFGFRRLQGKTQVLGPEQGDFHRNRLTHSIEVASIGRGISVYLKDLCEKKMASKNDDDGIYKSCFDLLSTGNNDSSRYCNYDYLISAICLLHDIGHPPFGHGGEIALNYKMCDGHFGFEANAQTLRIVTNLESYSLNFGLDLTRRTLLGLVKYPIPYGKAVGEYPSRPSRNEDIEIDRWKPPKCHYDDDNELIQWLSMRLSEEEKKEFGVIIHDDNNSIKGSHGKSKYKSFDCSIMDLADDIAYSIHDIEDAVFLGLINLEDLERSNENHELDIFAKDRGSWMKDFCDNKEPDKRKEAFGHIINTLISNIDIIPINTFNDPVFKINASFNSDAKNAIIILQKLIETNTYSSQEVASMVFGGMITVMQLFDAISSNPEKLLPSVYREKINNEGEHKHRIVCDYISGMTDEYARRLHDRIYGNLPGSAFEKL